MNWFKAIGLVLAVVLGFTGYVLLTLVWPWLLFLPFVLAALFLLTAVVVLFKDWFDERDDRARGR
jgi:urea transporter